MGRIANKMMLTFVLAVVVQITGNFVERSAHADEATPEVNPLSGDQKAIREGKSWYRGVCANCHGGRADGQGERGTGADLRKFSKGFKAFVEVVMKGREVPGRIQAMPAWGGVLKEEQIYQIGAYLETLAIDGANWK